MYQIIMVIAFVKFNNTYTYIMTRFSVSATLLITGIGFFSSCGKKDRGSTVPP